MILRTDGHCHSLSGGSFQDVKQFFLSLLHPVRQVSVCSRHFVQSKLWGNMMRCSMWQPENKYQGTMPWCNVGTRIQKSALSDPKTYQPGSDLLAGLL